MASKRTKGMVLVGVGIYSVKDAAAIANVPTRSITRWVYGYKYTTHAGNERVSPPVIQAEVETIEGARALSFLDLLETKFVSEVRRRGISWKTIRLAHKEASAMFQTTHPFCIKRYKTSGRTLFVRPPGGGTSDWVDLLNKQATIYGIMQPFFEDVDYENGGIEKAERWWLLGHRRSVFIDPEVSFGKPVTKERVPTLILAQAFKKTRSISTVADWYDIPEQSVQDAIDYENHAA